MCSYDEARFGQVRAPLNSSAHGPVVYRSARSPFKAEERSSILRRGYSPVQFPVPPRSLASTAVQPEIHFAGLTLQTFGICFALAFVAAGALVAQAPRRARQAGRLGVRDRPGRRSPAGSSARGSTSSSTTTTTSRTTFWATSSRASGWSGTAERSAGRSASASGRGAAGCSTPRCSTSARRRSPSATRSAASAASSPATATTASPGTGPWAMAYPHGTVPTNVTVHPTPDLRDARDGARRLPPLAASRPLPARDPVRDLPGPRGSRAPRWSSSSAATPTSRSASRRRSS